MSIRQWSQKYTAQTASLAEGVKIAKAQAPRMKHLMRNDPHSAYKAAMPEAEWKDLPQEVRQHVARRFSGFGQFEITIDDVTREARRQVTMTGFSSNNASVAAELENHRVYQGEITGITLGNDIAVTVMADEPKELIAAAEPDVMYATGNYKVLWLNIKYSDETNYPTSISSAQSTMATSASHFATRSYGRVNMTYDVDEVAIASTKGVSSFTLRSEAVAEARALGYTISDYDTVIYRTTNEGNWAWLWSNTVHLKTNSVGTTMHEIGHNMGLHHANWWRTDPGQPSWGSGTNVLYGESWSTMGGGGDFNAYEKKALGWLDVGTDYAEDISQGTYRIYAYDSHAANFDNTGVDGAYYAASLFKDDRETHGEAADRRYTFSFRNQPEQGNNGYNRWYQQGLLLYFEPWTYNGSGGYGVNGPFGSTIIDPHPQTSSLIGSKEQNDACIYIGETYVDNDPGNRDGDIFITPLTKTDPDGIPRNGDEYIDVKVVIGDQSGNQSPTGTLVADKLIVVPGETVNLHVNASDSDDTVLAYYWDFGLVPNKANRELMKLDGLPTQTFSWPADGIYTVKVVVSDCRGGTVELTQDIIVGDAHTVTFDLGTHGTRSGGGDLVQIVNNGGAAVAPSVSPNAGYVFHQWDKDFSNVTSDLTVYAEYRSSNNVGPDVFAGLDQEIHMHDGSSHSAHGSDHARMYNDGTGVVEGFLFEWEASHELDGDNIWASTTANSFNWTFSGNLDPVEVSDGRYNLLTHAFTFPAAKVNSGGSLSSFGSNEPATFEFVIDVDGPDGSIFESGGSGDGMQIDLVGGVLRGTVEEDPTEARVSYVLAAADYERFIHVVFVADNAANELKLYIDGELKDTQPWTAGEDWSGSDGSGLGSINNSIPDGGATTDFSGKMALMRFYRNKAFTEEEVHMNLHSLSAGVTAVAHLDDASVVDPEGDSFTSAWSLVSGPGIVNFADSTAINTTATFFTPGVYTLRLTADDGLAQGSDDVIITVEPPVATGFTSWISGYDLGEQSGWTDNPDSDRNSNMMEFAFGTDPSSKDMRNLSIDGSRHGDPISKKEPGGGFWFYFMRRADHKQSGSVNYTARFSSDLTNFHDSMVGLQVVATSTVDSNYQVVRVPFPAILPDGKAAKFACLRVEPEN